MPKWINKISKEVLMKPSSILKGYQLCIPNIILNKENIDSKYLTHLKKVLTQINDDTRQLQYRELSNQ